MTTKSDTVASWKGEFGEQYIARNPVNEESSRQAFEVFKRMLSDASLMDVSSILEVGANVGINLSGIRRLLPNVELQAIEPNEIAARSLMQSHPDVKVHIATAYEIPLPSNSVDLVFTNGVLIHVPPDQLARATSEICRVARRFVLCSEYFSRTPQEIVYHGQHNMLWKRDFGSLYLDNVPGLRTRAYGFTWSREFPLFDDLNWWVFEKAT